MKLKWYLILLFVVLIVAATKYFVADEKINVMPAVYEESSSLASDLPKEIASFSSEEIPVSSSSGEIGVSRVFSASSKESLSGQRVNALPDIVHFLNQIDNATIPKIKLPDPVRDPNFNYREGKLSEFRQKAMDGDPYAAYIYAEYLVKNGVRSVTDNGQYAYEPNRKKRIAAMDEAREFYIRAFQGGLASAAEVLSRLYADPKGDGSRIESLAWRKISFAVGESQRYDCLRNSTMCVVKDFNNMNRPEYFYPCLSTAGDNCSQNEYDNAMTLAMQYADSLTFALNNRVMR